MITYGETYLMFQLAISRLQNKLLAYGAVA